MNNVESERKYEFSWNLLGDVQLGAPIWVTPPDLRSTG